MATRSETEVSLFGLWEELFVDWSVGAHLPNSRYCHALAGAGGVAADFGCSNRAARRSFSSFLSMRFKKWRERNFILQFIVYFAKVFPPICK